MPDLPSLRAAWWAARALRRGRRQLRRGDLQTVTLPTAPGLPAGAIRGVRAVLRRGHATCLEKAVVLQRWHLAQGQPRTIVIGVTAPESGFRAHAWLEGDTACHALGYQELMRLAPR